MKRIVLLFAILSIIGCTKEKETNSIVGTWTLSEINTYGNSTLLLSGTEVSVRFNKNGSLDISGKPNYTFLRDANKYQIISNERIRFFDSTSNDEIFAVYQTDEALSLWYEVKCPYQEKFVRR